MRIIKYKCWLLLGCAVLLIFEGKGQERMDISSALKTVTTYMQCTAPPPAHLDLHPKICQTPVDCFPNLCCQEMDRKVCRPPKKSLLAFVAELGQKIIPEAAARKFIQRIS
ncbi:uncharacterized protein [Euwallacea fornicatus]|uniref:uncharacterized protein n=1 Tax=Euwallacea fornicatus TaxID=995702 RepID=UPI0033905CE1